MNIQIQFSNQWNLTVDPVRTDLVGVVQKNVIADGQLTDSSAVDEQQYSISDGTGHISTSRSQYLL
jgi:hypothetical protein